MSSEEQEKQRKAIDFILHKLPEGAQYIPIEDLLLAYDIDRKGLIQAIESCSVDQISELFNCLSISLAVDIVKGIQSAHFLIQLFEKMESKRAAEILDGVPPSQIQRFFNHLKLKHAQDIVHKMQKNRPKIVWLNKEKERAVFLFTLQTFVSETIKNDEFSYYVDDLDCRYFGCFSCLFLSEKDLADLINDHSDQFLISRWSALFETGYFPNVIPYLNASKQKLISRITGLQDLSCENLFHYFLQSKQSLIKSWAYQLSHHKSAECAFDPTFSQYFINYLSDACESMELGVRIIDSMEKDPIKKILSAMEREEEGVGILVPISLKSSKLGHIMHLWLKKGEKATWKVRLYESNGSGWNSQWIKTHFSHNNFAPYFSPDSDIDLDALIRIISEKSEQKIVIDTRPAQTKQTGRTCALHNIAFPFFVMKAYVEEDLVDDIFDRAISESHDLTRFLSALLLIAKADQA
ncbi:MAG: hypothetical protein VXZ72_03510 [Chlamydiota bacterium]|nr:hypothetical protein [Chlamydiota bacterium]